MSETELNPYRPPAAVAERAPRAVRRRRARRNLRFDTVRITAWVYACHLGILSPIFLLSASRALPPGTVLMQIAVCEAFALLAWSTTRHFRLGYCFCLVLSLVMLMAPPYGTVLGFNMLRALRENRDAFRAR